MPPYQVGIWLKVRDIHEPAFFNLWIPYDTMETAIRKQLDTWWRQANYYAKHNLWPSRDNAIIYCNCRVQFENGEETGEIWEIL